MQDSSSPEPEDSLERKRSCNARAFVVLGACTMVNLILGTQYTYANMSPYVISYIRARSSPSDIRYVDFTWITASNMIGRGVVMVTGGILERKLGPRFAILIASAILCAGVSLSYFTLQHSYLATVVTYGVLFGIGSGMAIPIPFGCTMRWFRERRGIASGLPAAGFCFGNVIFNPIITAYINPDNYSPDKGTAEELYFSQSDLLDRVPMCFLLLGGTYAAVLLACCFFVVDPPTLEQDVIPDLVRYSKSTEKRTEKCLEAELLNPPETGTENPQATGTENPHETGTENSKKTEIQHTQETGTENTKETRTENIKETRTETTKKTGTENIKETGTENTQETGNESKGHDNPGEKEEISTVEIIRQDSGVWDKSLTDVQHLEDIHPLKGLRDKTFYIFWLIFMLGRFADIFLATQYKNYGLTFINNDQFLSAVASASSVSSGLGSICWGYFHDMFSSKVALRGAVGGTVILTASLIGCEHGGKEVFFVWVCLFFFVAVAGLIGLVPPVASKLWGNKYVSVYFGLLYTSQIVTGAASAFLGQILKDSIGWHGMFYMLAGITAIGFLLIFLLDTKTPEGKEF